MMGAGKSTVGRVTAARLGRRFVDVDDEVVRSTGRSVAELFASGGETTFRTVESQALARCLDTDDGAVVAVGGGAVLDPDNRGRLARAGTVVWLRARPGTLAARVGGGGDRPLLEAGTDGPLAVLEALAERRAPLYQAVSSVVIDVDDLSPDDVADRLCALVAAPS